MGKVIEFLRFYECEHEGDLEYYEEDIYESSREVRITDSRVDFDREIGYVTLQFNSEKDKKDFYEKFEKTKAYRFLT